MCPFKGGGLWWLHAGSLQPPLGSVPPGGGRHRACGRASAWAGDVGAAGVGVRVRLRQKACPRGLPCTWTSPAAPDAATPWGSEPRVLPTALQPVCTPSGHWGRVTFRDGSQVLGGPLCPQCMAPRPSLPHLHLLDALPAGAQPWGSRDGGRALTRVTEGHAGGRVALRSWPPGASTAPCARDPEAISCDRHPPWVRPRRSPAPHTSGMVAAECRATERRGRKPLPCPQRGGDGERWWRCPGCDEE